MFCPHSLSSDSWSDLVISFGSPHTTSSILTESLFPVSTISYSASLLWVWDQFRFFCTAKIFSVMSFEKGEKGRLQVTPVSRVEGCCLADWRCWRHLNLPLCSMVVKMTWLPCTDSCFCQLYSCNKERNYKSKCSTRWGRENSFGEYNFFAFRGGEEGGNQMETET